jgi:hypothetical protein
VACSSQSAIPARLRMMNSESCMPASLAMDADWMRSREVMPLCIFFRIVSGVEHRAGEGEKWNNPGAAFDKLIKKKAK